MAGISFQMANHYFLGQPHCGGDWNSHHFFWNRLFDIDRGLRLDHLSRLQRLGAIQERAKNLNNLFNQPATGTLC